MLPRVLLDGKFPCLCDKENGLLHLTLLQDLLIYFPTVYTINRQNIKVQFELLFLILGLSYVLTHKLIRLILVNVTRKGMC